MMAMTLNTRMIFTFLSVQLIFVNFCEFPRTKFFSSLGNEIKVLLVSPHSKQIFVNISVRIINYKPCK